MWKPAVCIKDCPDTCGFLVKVKNGRITKVKACSYGYFDNSVYMIGISDVFSDSGRQTNPGHCQRSKS